ncbi:MAG: hypothetical protein AAGF32_10950, partial [Pseudomonadota bacterium]
MRIVFASGCAPWPFSRGGAEISAGTLMRGLRQRAHQVHVFGSLDNYIFSEARSLPDAARVLSERNIDATWHTSWQGQCPDCTYARYAAGGVSITAVEREAHLADLLRAHVLEEPPDIIVTQLNRSHLVAEVAAA